jgi:Fe-S cluster assembly ATP-binding protein
MLPLLKVENLSVLINAQPVVHNVTLTIMPGTLHILMGPNGSGKSSLSSCLMGYPQFETTGTITFNNEDITSLPIHKRAQRGLFLAVQQPPEIPGVTLLTFLKESYTALHNKPLSVEECKAQLAPLMAQLNLDASFLSRSFNEGFSGGEKKKCELLQMLFLNPKLAILDEIDSGIDIDGIRLIADMINARKQRNDVATILITHSPHLLELIQPDFVHIMHKGSLAYSGSREVLPHITAKGYDGLVHL